MQGTQDGRLSVASGKRNSCRQVRRTYCSLRKISSSKPCTMRDPDYRRAPGELETRSWSCWLAKGRVSIS
jgi:hypothetical protein